MKKILKSLLINILDTRITNVDNSLFDIDKPIYHYHVRKTAGTSINFSFIKTIFDMDPIWVYNQLSANFIHRFKIKNKSVVGWDNQLIRNSKYNFGFSHSPFHELNLSTDLYTFTCLRDPAKRVISHYNMLRYYRDNNIQHPCMKEEGKWVENGFKDFLEQVPAHHFLNQLFMFSKNFNVQEAVNNLSTLNRILFQENLNNDIEHFSQELGVTLVLANEKKYQYNEKFLDKDLDILREKLYKEYELLDIVKKELYK